MKLLLAASVVLAALLASSELATRTASTDVAPADEDTSFLEMLSSDSGTGQRQRCRSRRGIGETKSVGKDCVEKEQGDLIKVEFPMKQVKIEFPCVEPFHATPLVVATVLGPNKNKLYATSLRNVSNTYFTVNIQRVDDIENPDMHCDELFLSYVAVVLG